MAEEQFTNDLGFIVEEDQSEAPLPDENDWQTEFHNALRRSWVQGFNAKSKMSELDMSANPYADRDQSDVRVVTWSLGWVEGFLAAKDDGSIDDCPYPEA